jgi:hypothetical protein
MRVIHNKFKKATSTSKGKIIISTFFLVILLAIVGAVVYWQTNKKRLIREKLESAIDKKSGGFYSIKYETMEMDEISGFLSITNLSLRYDSAQINALKDIGMVPPTLFTINVPELVIQGVQTPRALIDKEISGRKLEIKNPSIEIIYTMQGKDSARRAPTAELYRQILGNFKEISVDTVLISNASISTFNAKTKQSGVTIGNANMVLLDVHIDSVANADTSRLLFSKQAVATCEEISWKSDNKLYRYLAKNISLHSVNRTATVGAFIVDPQAGEDAFVKSLPTQDDRFDFIFNDLHFKNLDFQELMNDKLIADTLVVDAAVFNIYRDLNMPRDRKNRVGSYPHQVLAKLPAIVDIRKLILQNASLKYKERNNITKKAGEVKFHGIYATIHNLTNRKEALINDNTMNVDISCRFLNKAPFNLSWIFYLGKNNGQFKVKGSLGSIRGEDLNPITEAMGPARIERGVIKGLNFDFNGTDYQMDGTLVMKYKDLKVALLEKDKGSADWDKKSLTSFVANFFIKNSNPRDDDEDAVTVTVTNDRNTNRSIFNVTWKTMFKAISETVGMKKKKT